MKFTALDYQYMQSAIELARQGEFTAHPNPRVGCLLVKDNMVVGEGLHWQTGGLHAERHALAIAQEKAENATCYVTLEPCAHQGRTSACIDALIAAKLKRVVIAAIDPNPLVKGRGIQALERAGILVDTGVCEKEAIALNIGFYSRMLRKRPYVRAKIAMSLDGRLAMKSGESQWITSQASRHSGQLWRARSGAIITGAQTVLQDNCRLTVRESEFWDLTKKGLFRQPLRVVIDSKGRVPSTATIFQQPGSTLIATAVQREAIDCLIIPLKNGQIDLAVLLLRLAEREINDVLIEAGPNLVGAFLQLGLVDELLVYIAPKLLGSESQPMANLPGMQKLSDHIAGAFCDMQRMGPDLHVVLKLTDEGWTR